MSLCEWDWDHCISAGLAKQEHGELLLRKERGALFGVVLVCRPKRWVGRSLGGAELCVNNLPLVFPQPVQSGGRCRGIADGFCASLFISFLICSIG